MWLKRATCLDKRVTGACYTLKLKLMQNTEDKLNLSRHDELLF